MERICVSGHLTTEPTCICGSAWAVASTGGQKVAVGWDELNRPQYVYLGPSWVPVEGYRERVVIWLDDVRDPSSTRHAEYIFVRLFETLFRIRWVKNFDEFRPAFEAAVSEGNLFAIFFDNDLGSYETQGKDIFKWVEEQVRTRNLPPFELFSQSANTSARINLSGGFEALRNWWGSR